MPACHVILIDRLEEIKDSSGLETLQQFDTRMEGAAQALLKEEWLADLVAAGGSPPEILRLPSSQSTEEVSACHCQPGNEVLPLPA